MDSQFLYDGAMFGFGKRPARPAKPVRPIRDTLFGDLPLDEWPAADSPGASLTPWSLFVEAREALKRGRRDQAIVLWSRIANTPSLESRHYAQAWHFLREQGVSPPPTQAQRLFGVVLEVPMKDTHDLLAVYPEYAARYYNYSGAGVVWEHPDSSLDGVIDAVLIAGRQTIKQIGPWSGARLPVPPAGQMRISFLAPSGLHFGQGPLDVMMVDPLAKPVFDAGTILLHRLVTLAESARRK